ncbi:MAG: EVE domain-containing protein [Bdellovibrionaceae bacterium]|nr:EVE domain-containing protein [Pseudobdellovibrionaceae bacterium]
MSKKYWLMKSEPEVFSIDDLKKDKTTLWEGVRNYQARNFMTQEMSIGDEVLFYHSNAKPPGVAGLAKVSKPAAPDPTAFDKKSTYFEPKATPERPIWECVEVKFVEKFKTLLSLDELREHKALTDMMLLKKGSRLSIQPVTPKQFDYICKLAKK